MGTATATPPPVMAYMPSVPLMAWHRTNKRWTMRAPATSEIQQSQFYTFIVLQGEYDGQIAVFRHDTLTVPVDPYAVWTAQTARNLWNSCISRGWRIA